VRFTNARTGEYLYHELQVDVTAPGLMETLTFEAPVRQSARRFITIDNPLPPSMPVTFVGEDDAGASAPGWWRCDDPHVRLTRHGEMMGNKEGTFEVEYRPLAPLLEPKTASLSFDIAELGTYKYALKLSATPPPSTPQLRFEAPLGGQQVETFTFRAFNVANTNFELKVKHPEFFEIPPTVAVEPSPTWEGVDVRVQIKFEPEALGNLSDTLVINGGDAGEYRCSLLGVCKRPQPQGPFIVAKNGTKEITFRNVFGDTREFSFTVDHAAFAVSTATQNIAARTEVKTTVSFKPPDASELHKGETEIAAKLFVRCLSPDFASFPPWVFYLRGNLAD